MSSVRKTLHQHLASLLLAGILGAPMAACGAGQDEPGSPLTVHLTSGRVKGSAVGESNVFLGIPYAKAPVGPLRFALPEPAETWSGLRQANALGPACVQAEGVTSSATGEVFAQDEDCLSLSVYAPAETVSAGSPVMVFLHGGGGNSGSGRDYDGQSLSEAGDVVVVSINYRLGALAWVVHADLDAELGTTSGNLALRDQQLALRWVRDNIAAFGGDPANVTLFGESAGAAAVCMHMFATGGEDLVNRYIMQSGGCVGSAVQPGTRAGVEGRSDRLVAHFCGDAEHPIDCLRDLDAEAVARWSNNVGAIRDASGPYVDGELIPGLPRDLLAAGDFHRGAVLLGSNLHESDFLASDHFGGDADWPLVENADELTAVLTFMYPDDASALASYYGPPADDADANRVLTKVMDDSWMHCPTRSLAIGAAAAGQDVYLYSFDLEPAVHVLELDYVFGNDGAPFSKLFEGAPIPQVPGLVELVQGCWTRFARTGNPNGDGVPAWPEFKAASRRHLVLDVVPGTGTDLYRADCDFWLTTVAGGQ